MINKQFITKFNDEPDTYITSKTLQRYYQLLDPEKRKFNKIDDIFEYEKYCQDFYNSRFDRINECEYLYRTLGWAEICYIIDGRTVNILDKRKGFSFSKEKLYSDYLFKLHEHDEKNNYLVTFNNSVLLDNFNIIEIYPSIEFLKNNPDLVYHIMGFMHGGNEYVVRHRILQELNNKEFESWNIKDLIYYYLENIYDIINTFENRNIIGVTGIEFPVNKNNMIKQILQKATIPECIIRNSYHFVPGMIKNIEASEENIEGLYNFCIEHKDELQLDL
jgi:hypothetical protein